MFCTSIEAFSANSGLLRPAANRRNQVKRVKTRATILTSVVTVAVCSILLLLTTRASSPAARAPEVSSLVANEPVAPLPNTLDPVVSTDWLAARLGAPDLITLHVGPGGSYEDEHIPGSRNASLRRLLRVNEAGIRDEMLPVEEIADALAELGVDDRSKVVIYFSEGNAAWAAARYMLTMEFIGMSGRVAYLDGGLPKWVSEGRPAFSGAPAHYPGQLTAEPVTDVIVDTEWLRARLGHPGMAIVDGRPPELYAGEDGEGDRAGHIPGAGNVPFFTLLSDDLPYLLKSREELSSIFREAGVEKADTVVVYCGTGLWGSLPYLAARHLGYEVRLYDGSFEEWSTTDGLPTATGSTPNGSD
jgi:thiosulfate/3-mercaptopyruvate sulfurtransferase